jgi:hypothetical protein
MPIITWSFRVAEDMSYGSIVGKLCDEDGNPFDPNDVEIRFTQNDQRLRIPKIESNGSFEALDLETGIWTVSFYIYGYNEYRTTELIQGNKTTYMGTVTLYEIDDTSTLGDEMDLKFYGGACCILLLFVLILILFVSNQKLKAEKEKNTKLVDKLEKLLDTHHEE